jgi:hypothetical protein
MMRASSEQYTVAWFTLAECVSRGERERAFGVYRLLAHSLDDRALAVQLEGDLFCAFKMPSQAIDRYQTAVRLYKQAGRFLEAASVCEHIRSLDPHHMQCQSELLDLYSTLQFELRVSEVAVSVALLLGAQELYDVVVGLVPTIEKLHSFGSRARCYAAITYALHEQESVPTSCVHFFAGHAAHAYIRHGDDVLLEQYIAQVKALDDDIYAAVRAALKE